MIIALEGPDCSGKTSVFKELKHRLSGVVFVPTLPISAVLLQHMQDVESRQIALWEALYNPHALYVCDRSVFVSGPVYDYIYCRGNNSLSYEKWRAEVRVVYFDVPLYMLQTRYALNPDEHFNEKKYMELLEAYEKLLPRYNYVRIDASRSKQVVADQAEQAIRNFYVHKI